MKLTVITPVYNGEKYLRETLVSVLSQKGDIDIEYIVVDGGSTDNTIKIITDYALRMGKQKNIQFFWISEKDKGIADAFNKGVKMSHGDYIYFLGADDILKSPYVIAHMMDGIDPKKDMLIAGKVDRIKDTKKYSVLYTSSLRFFPLMLLYKMALPHQGMFMSRKFFDTYGFFDTTLQYAMDYELLLRAYKKFPRVICKDIVVAGWREGGVGKNKLYEILDEYHRIRMRNHIAHPWILRIIHEIVKLRYRFSSV